MISNRCDATATRGSRNSNRERIFTKAMPGNTSSPAIRITDNGRSRSFTQKFTPKMSNVATSTGRNNARMSPRLPYAHTVR